MSNKLLSIIIPTYNMEKLLPYCLDSLCNVNRADLIEAIVVNDGSKDNSLQVAKEYSNRYPEIITIIDKPNGNYGSTINAALPIAKGTYIKILDSDDTYDTVSLDSFLNELVEINTDIAVTHFTQLGPGSKKEVIRYNTMGREVYEYGKVYNLDDVLKDGYIRFFLMHSLTYRTELLRSFNYKQTEGISYTDTEWAIYPIFHADSITFFNINLYQYNMGRPGQTMDSAVLMKSVNQLETVTDKLIEFYRNFNRDTLSETRAAFLKQLYENRLRIMYKIYLLDMPRKDFNKTCLEQLDKKYKKYCAEFNLKIKLYPENKILRLDYISYWDKHHKRWPIWFERVNSFIDIIIKWLYVKIFRR